MKQSLTLGVFTGENLEWHAVEGTLYVRVVVSCSGKNVGTLARRSEFKSKLCHSLAFVLGQVTQLLKASASPCVKWG